MPPQTYQQPRELSDQEFDAIVERLINEAPTSLDNEQDFNRWLKPRLEAAVGEAENLPPKPQGSAAGRFASSAWEMVNPVEMVKGAYQAVRHPIDTVTGLVGAQMGTLGRAAEDVRAGRYGEGFARGTLGAVPIVGPLIEEAADRMGTGDVAGGLGTVAGLAAPGAAVKGVRAARAAVPAGTRARAAAKLTRSAHDRIADVMAPRVGKEKTRYGVMAEKIAPQVGQMLVEEGAPMTTDALYQQIGGRYGRAADALDEATDARLAARTFDEPRELGIVKSLKGKRSEQTAEAVVASNKRPQVTPPSPEAVKAFEGETAKIAKAEKDFLLRWLQKDLEEMSFQPGGAPKIDEAARNWRPGDPEAARYGIGKASARGAGTPTLKMFHKFGITGSRAEIAKKIENLLAGKTKGNPKLEALADALREAVDPDTRGFNFEQVSDATLARLGPKVTRRDFEQPMVAPHLDDANQAIAARIFPEEVPFEVMPLDDPIAPQPKKRGQPLGQDVVPGPNAPRVGMVDQAIGEVKALGPSVRYESIRKIRQAYDKPARMIYSRTMTDDFLKKTDEAAGAADVTGVLREALGRMDPETAKANGVYHTWRTARDVMKAAAEGERVRPKTGRLIAARIVGLLTGARSGTVGAIAGTVLAPGLEAALTAPTTKLKTARLMLKLAEAAKRGDVGQVESVSSRLKSLVKQATPATAVQVSRTTSPSGYQTQPTGSVP